MKYVRFNIKADIRRRRAATAMSCVFIAVLLSVGILGFIFERPVKSELENRELEKFPKLSFDSYFSGEFTAALDRYFTDTVPFRDTLTECAALLENAKGIPSPQFYGVKIVNDKLSGEADAPDAAEETAVTGTEAVLPEVPEASEAVEREEYSAIIPDEPMVMTEETTESLLDTETTVPETNDEEFVGDINDFLNNGILVNGVDMYGEKAGIMLFGGNDKQGERYAGLISEYKKKLGDDINVYNLVVPTSVEFYLPKKYGRFSNSEKDEIDFIYSKLTNGVIPVDAYSVLEEHKDEYIYFRTDHHWSDLGAYYAYTAFCKAIGQEPPPLTDYETITRTDPYVGSLYGYTTDITLKNNPDVFTYYKTRSEFVGESFYYDTLKSAGINPIYHEYASGSGMYGMFLGSDSMHIKIKTSAGTGRKIVMFKESYGNAFAPYLIDSFDEIYVIDIRYFGRNAVDYIKEVGATDVLFINNVFAANTSMLIDGIERMLTSPTGTIVYTAPETVTETTAATTTETTASSTTTSSPAASEKAALVTASETTAATTTVTETSSETAPPSETTAVTSTATAASTAAETTAAAPVTEKTSVTSVTSAAQTKQTSGQ